MNDFKLNESAKTGFKIPEQYFEDFSAKILAQVSEDQVPVIPINQKRKAWIFAAAAVLVLALAIPFINNFSDTSSEPDAAALENYISMQENISDDDLVELLEKDDIEKIKFDFDLEDKTIEDALSGDSDLQHYLIY